MTKTHTDTQAPRWIQDMLLKFFAYSRTEDGVPILHSEADKVGFEALKIFIQQTLTQQAEEILSTIKPFDLVEDCHPDCDEVEHAYHKGTWDAHLKLEKMLQKLKERYKLKKEI